jgi:DNA-directed RNA polymerase specialized sigma24 family protein
MALDGSVTRWLAPLGRGDPEAARQVWERYFVRLVELARAKLQGAPRRVADEEDVALNALDSLCRGAAQGRFEQLCDRESLWRILVVIADRKAAHQRRDLGRHKRGGQARREPLDDDLPGREPTPEAAAEFADRCRHFLALLPDDVLRTVALARMHGDAVEEIAARLDCTPRTVKRKLQVIRSLWEREAGR